MLSMVICRTDWATGMVDAVPFRRLERMCLCVLHWGTLGAVLRVLEEKNWDRIDTLSMCGPALEKRDEILAIGRLGNLEELRLAYSQQQGGDIAKALARKERLRRLEVNTIVYTSTGITAEDVGATVAIESLRELVITNINISLDMLEVLVKNKKFVDRLETLFIRVRVETTPGETLAELGEVGMVDEDGYFTLETGSINAAVPAEEWHL